MLSLIIECRFEVGDGVQAPLLQVVPAAADSVLLPSHLQEVRPFGDGFQDWLTLWADTSTFSPSKCHFHAQIKSCSQYPLRILHMELFLQIDLSWLEKIQNPIIPWFVLRPLPQRKVWLEAPEGAFVRDSVEEVVYLDCILWQPYSPVPCFIRSHPFYFQHGITCTSKLSDYARIEWLALHLVFDLDPFIRMLLQD